MNTVTLNAFHAVPSKWDYWITKKIINNLQTHIHSVLNKLQLKPTMTVKVFLQKTKGYKHRYYSECYDLAGNKYFFYALLKNDELSKKSFNKEIDFATFTIHHDFLLKKTVPQYIRCSNTDAVPWILSKYIPVLPLENKAKMERLNHAMSFGIASLIAKQLFHINFDILSKIRPHIHLEYFNVEDEIKNTINSQLTMLEARNYIDPASHTKAIKLFIDTYNILTAENKYFTHGDFHIGNIFQIHKEKTNIIRITDWETYRLSNFAFDITYLYARLSKEPEARKKILSEYMRLIPQDKIEKFKILFRLNIAYFAIKDGVSASYLELTTQEVEDRQLWFKNLFLKSLSSFEEIILL